MLEVAGWIVGIVLTSDNYVFKAAGDGAVAFWCEYGFIAGFEPGDAVFIGDEGFLGFFGVVPVSFCELVARHAEFSALTDWDDVAFGVDDLGFCVWHDLAYGHESGFNCVSGNGIKAGW